MLVSAMYFLFVMPISLCNMADSDVSSPELQLAFFCVYWMQYSLNCVVYAFRSGPYRKAYIFFIKEIRRGVKECFSRKKSVRRPDLPRARFCEEEDFMTDDEDEDPAMFFSERTVVLTSECCRECREDSSNLFVFGVSRLGIGGSGGGVASEGRVCQRTGVNALGVVGRTNSA